MNIKERKKYFYKNLLKQYAQTRDEKVLGHAKKLTKFLIENCAQPEEIVRTHIKALEELYPEFYKEAEPLLNFLLETMVYYGLSIEKYKTLQKKQLEIDNEIALASNVQQSLLATTIPTTSYLDIGVISVPANQMNGDYYHFITGEDDTIGVALADVIGKGIPAALCMSMIRYAMDSFPENIISPPEILRRLNHVVERNVDSNMFISMFYARYSIVNQTLVYSSAGHEPGLYYRAETNTFHSIKTKGLLLGVLPSVEYPQYEQHLNKDDMIILLTDGVTECRKEHQFKKRKELLKVIKRSMHLSAQQIVEKVYCHFEQRFDQQDDFTLIVMRKK
ncbi:phosphoserine phosphatase [Cerasibacillus terrae]|uniref:Phosphoserine phosphatase n=1 Tax=Cerasibacillus terrae TaxID=2498845 RepID=A0A5C8NKL3_9BACI|nr:PP2C family protein-serine/threonine phosphatase [Cerasibacillus terrae]TXL61680.1 phosphoserine phosphatase [Cerasibacillus terrae]